MEDQLAFLPPCWELGVDFNQSGSRTHVPTCLPTALCHGRVATPMPHSLLHAASSVGCCFLLPGTWSSHAFTLAHQPLHAQQHQQLMLVHSPYSSLSGSRSSGVEASRRLFEHPHIGDGLDVRRSPPVPFSSVYASSRDSKMRLNCTPGMSCLGAGEKERIQRDMSLDSGQKSILVRADIKERRWPLCCAQGTEKLIRVGKMSATS